MMGYRLKIGPSQGLKLKGAVGFGLPMVGRTGIKATKTGGIWYVELDYSLLSPGPVTNATTAMVAVLDQVAGIYKEVSLASLLTSGLDADLQAIAALTSNGILVRTADNAWALRTLTGTANEITVTNGDGVSGNPTVSLPAALTFAGKTVTGGTFDGLTITNSTFNGNAWTAGTGTLTIAAGKTLTASDNATVSGANTGDQTITLTGDVTGTGTGSFAATIGATKVTSAMLNADVFSTAHTWSGQQTFTAPVLGTPASGVATNLTGTASGLTAGHVTTNANLTGDVTSVGNATTLNNAPVIAKVLTGYTSGAGTVSDTDSILSAIQKLDGNDALKAPLASPALTGTPTAPTASPSDNSTKIATTAYVDAQVAGGVAGVASLNGQTGAINLVVTKQVFTSSGTYTPSTGMLYAIIECVGGGGGGGGALGAVSQSYGAGGGGAGGYGRKIVSASDVGGSQIVTIGAGGAGGTAGKNDGTAGGSTAIGSLCGAVGGSGGNYGNGSQVSLGGAGGLASSGIGDLTATGGAGQSGVYASSTGVLASGGMGGASYFGGGGRGGFSTTAAAGNAATSYGAGGGGAMAHNSTSTAAGGAGAGGVVMITEYCVQ